MSDSFWPKDTDTEMFLSADLTLQDIIDKVSHKWPGVSNDNITLSSEYIHTSCLTYDRYDPGDYTEFLHITKIE